MLSKNKDFYFSLDKSVKSCIIEVDGNNSRCLHPNKNPDRLIYHLY